MFEILYGFSIAFNIFLCVCCYYLASEIQSYKYIIKKASQVLEKDIEKMVKEATDDTENQ